MKLRQLSIFIVLILSCFLFTKCTKESATYSFFVAGHVYGSPSGNSVHIHPPFKENFPYIRSQAGMSFGVFTGDMVRKSIPQNFDTLVSELQELGLPYYVVPGNHDIGNRKLYEKYFGDKKNKNKTYSSFEYKGDLFIFLDGNLNQESISGEQLEFLKSTLYLNGSSAKNIFVFVHQLIWWKKDNEFKNIVTNWPPNTPGSNNYWSDVEPLFESTRKPVYLFAGDLGANHPATPFMYYKKENITYVAGGMGHKKQDNIIIVNVNETGKVNLELVALQGDANSLGSLEDYVLP